MCVCFFSLVAFKIPYFSLVSDSFITMYLGDAHFGLRAWGDISCMNLDVQILPYVWEVFSYYCFK